MASGGGFGVYGAFGVFQIWTDGLEAYYLSRFLLYLIPNNSLRDFLRSLVGILARITEACCSCFWLSTQLNSTHFCGGKGIRGVAVYGSVDYADFMEGCDCGCHGGSHEGSMHATPTPGRTADPGSCDDESRGLKTSRKTPHHAFSRTDLLADVPIWSYFAANCFGRWSSSVAYGTEASFLVKDH